MKTKTPKGLDARGRTFWRAIADNFELSVSEAELLLETCRTLDAVERLEEALRGDLDPKLLAEVRQQRLALGRMLAQLQIPADALESPGTIRARKAAEARWAGKRRNER